jgi:hypothetical protein
MLVVGAIVTVASAFIPGVEQWGPLFALWTVGAAQLAWIVSREAKDNGRRAPTRRTAA